MLLSSSGTLVVFTNFVKMSFFKNTSTFSIVRGFTNILVLFWQNEYTQSNTYSSTHFGFGGSSSFRTCLIQKLNISVSSFFTSILLIFCPVSAASNKYSAQM